MTPLTKTIERVCTRTNGNGQRPLVVTFEPGDVFTVRVSRQRKAQALRAPVSALYRQLAQWKADAERRLKSHH